MKTTTHGRRPKNIKSGIAKQALIGFYPNFKLKLRCPNYIVQIFEIKRSSNGRRTQIEDDLKILKGEQLSNQLLDHAEMLIVSCYAQIIFCKSFK
jgi:hypothetical protein